MLKVAKVLPDGMLRQLDSSQNSGRPAASGAFGGAATRGAALAAPSNPNLDELRERLAALPPDVLVQFFAGVKATALRPGAADVQPDRR